MVDPDLAAVVEHSGGSYPVVAGWGVIERLGDKFVDLGIAGPVYIITDENVMHPYGRAAQWALQRSGIAAHCFIIPAGETSKNFGLAQAIYEWLVGLKAERGHAIVAVGGGVVGDLAGFVASTFIVSSLAIGQSLIELILIVTVAFDEHAVEGSGSVISYSKVTI